jgi:hypothetical protein
VPTQRADLVGVGFAMQVASDHRRESRASAGGDERHEHGTCWQPTADCPMVEASWVVMSGTAPVGSGPGEQHRGAIIGDGGG